MPPLQQWVDFINLAEMDGAGSDDRAGQARNMLAALANYMEHRFTTRDTRLLADLVMSEAVRSAVISGIEAQAQAAVDIKAAAEAVAAAVSEP